VIMVTQKSNLSITIKVNWWNSKFILNNSCLYFYKKTW
jgi:hypothetical protein